MTTHTGRRDAASPTLPAALSKMLREAALIHRLDAQAAEQVAQTGLLDINGTPVVTRAVDATGSRGITYNDVVLVSPLAYIKAPTVSQLAFLLDANFPIMTTLGCAFSRTQEGVLQVVHATRLGDLNARRLAEKQWSLLAVVVSMRQQLEEHTTATQAPAGDPLETTPDKTAGVQPRT